MPNVYVEPLPKGDLPATPTSYQLEFQDGSKSAGPFKTQKEAIDAAKALGHSPLVAHVRNTNKGIRDHWRSA